MLCGAQWSQTNGIISPFGPFRGSEWNSLRSCKSLKYISWASDKGWERGRENNCTATLHVKYLCWGQISCSVVYTRLMAHWIILVARQRFLSRVCSSWCFYSLVHPNYLPPLMHFTLSVLIVTPYIEILVFFNISHPQLKETVAPIFKLWGSC